jgi:hypothetical protein
VSDESLQPYLKPEFDEAAKQLLRAAELIERFGWCQYRGREGERFCLYEALQRVTYNGVHFYVARQRFLVSMGISSLITWNDTPGRRKEEVLSALRAVALGG